MYIPLACRVNPLGGSPLLQQRGLVPGLRLAPLNFRVPHPSLSEGWVALDSSLCGADVQVRHNKTQRAAFTLRAAPTRVCIVHFVRRGFSRAEGRRRHRPSARGATEVSPARKRWVSSPREASTARGALPASLCRALAVRHQTRTVFIRIETRRRSC